MDDLGIGKTECLQEMEGGDSLAASFVASIEESVGEQQFKLYAEGLI